MRYGNLMGWDIYWSKICIYHLDLAVQLNKGGRDTLTLLFVLLSIPQTIYHCSFNFYVYNKIKFHPSDFVKHEYLLLNSPFFICHSQTHQYCSFVISTWNIWLFSYQLLYHIHINLKCLDVFRVTYKNQPLGLFDFTLKSNLVFQLEYICLQIKLQVYGLLEVLKNGWLICHSV